MFYLQLALLFEDWNSGRISDVDYHDGIVLLATDHMAITEMIRNSLQRKLAA